MTTEHDSCHVMGQNPLLPTTEGVITMDRRTRALVVLATLAGMVLMPLTAASATTVTASGARLTSHVIQPMDDGYCC
jgi:hypothetical protein